MHTSNEKAEVGVKVSPTLIGCFVLLVSFFLPWVNILGMGVAGHQLHEVWSAGRFIWIIPAASVLAIGLALSGRRYMEIAQCAGGIPLVVLAVAIYQNGTDLFPALLIGAYLSLLSGLFLLCVAPRMVRKANAAPRIPKPGSL